MDDIIKTTKHINLNLCTIVHFTDSYISFEFANKEVEFNEMWGYDVDDIKSRYLECVEDGVSLLKINV